MNDDSTIEERRQFDRAHALYQLAVQAIGESRLQDLFALMMERSRAIVSVHDYPKFSEDEVQTLFQETQHLLKIIGDASLQIQQSLQAEVRTMEARLAYAHSRTLSESGCI